MTYRRPSRAVLAVWNAAIIRARDAYLDTLCPRCGVVLEHSGRARATYCTPCGHITRAARRRWAR